MNPLFKNATRAFKAAIRTEMRSSRVGQIIRAVERQRLRKGGVARFKREIIRGAHGPLAARMRQALPGFERYAKKQADKAIWDELIKIGGPLGMVIEAMFRPTGKALTGNATREQNAYANFLRAFGWVVTAPPKKRGGQAAELQAITEHLGQLGFKVVPASATQGFNPQINVGPQPGGYKPLPGWAARAHQQQTKPPLPDRIPKPRKTIDVNFGDGKMRRVKLDDPIVTGEMINVVSSNVHSIGFDINTHTPVIGTLKVRFYQTVGATARGAKVAGALYYYYNVPTDIFRRFQRAASKGKFVWDNLRIRGTVSGHKYDYSLAGIRSGYVPRKATNTLGGEMFAKRSFFGQNEKTGERRLFHSRESAMVRPGNGRPDNGRPAGPNRGRR